MKNFTEKILEMLWYNPKKALAFGIAAGVIFAKIFKKGIFAAALLLVAGKIYKDAADEQKGIIEEI